MEGVAIWSGPILRRCQRELVCMQVATSTAISDAVALELFRILEKGASEKLEGKLKVREVKILGACFLSMLTFIPTIPLPTEVEIGYDLIINGISITKNNQNVCFVGRTLPSFVVQSDRQPLNLAFVSCRKPHFDGEDAISAILSRYGRPAERPHAIVLGGDQIYADDVNVHTSLLLHISVAGKLNTKDPVTFVASKISREQFFEDFSDRRNLLKDFTSGMMDYQLISWPEFVGMYLIAWSPNLLASLTDDELPREKDYKILCANSSDRFKSGELKEFVQKLIADAKIYALLMANTPIYMVGDDHEITDDWGIDGNWIDRNISPDKVWRAPDFPNRPNPNSVDVIRHGMASYFLFQIWGNDPENNQDMVEIFRDVSLLADYGKTETLKVAREIDQALADFTSGGGFCCSIQTNPVVVIIDTRMDRGPVSASSIRRENRDINLFGDTTKEKLKSLIQNSNGHEVVVCSPVPIFNIHLLRGLQERFNRTFDFDEWSANPIDLLRLMSVAKRKKLYYLSGDVHFSSSATIRLMCGAEELKVVQIVSSAVKNGNDAVAGLLDRRGTKHFIFKYNSLSGKGSVSEFNSDVSVLSSSFYQLICVCDFAPSLIKDANVFYGQFDGTGFVGRWLTQNEQTETLLRRDFDLD